MESIWSTQTPESRPIAVVKTLSRDKKIFTTIESPDTGPIEFNPRKRIFEDLESLT